jgi:bifunctional DNA-binding transcriptional regulator/antitoxin component of YhaV-PrlF toxin-antitoxin module
MHHITLRRVNSTLRMRVPSEFTKQRSLREGDQVVWIEEGDSVRLEFVRLQDVVAAIPQREPETADAE